MKRNYFILAIAALSLGSVWAQDGVPKPNQSAHTIEKDTISMEGNLEQIHIIATRANQPLWPTPILHKMKLAAIIMVWISHHCWLSPRQ